MKRLAPLFLCLLVSSAAVRAEGETEALRSEVADLKGRLAEARASFDAERKALRKEIDQIRDAAAQQKAARASATNRRRRAMADELARALHETAAAKDRRAMYEARAANIERALRQARFDNERLRKIAAAEHSECTRVILTLGEEAQRRYSMRRKTRFQLRLAVQVIRDVKQPLAVDDSPNGACETLAAAVLKHVPEVLRGDVKTGDTDKDGKVELLDAWGNPIAYLSAGKTAVVVNTKGQNIRVEPATRNPKLAKDEFELVSLGPNGKRDKYDQPGSDDLDTGDLARR